MEKLRDYKISKTEEKIIKKSFLEYIEPCNNSFENISQPEFDQFYEFFKTGWILANIIGKEEE
jgi:hypothetical protein